MAEKALDQLQDSDLGEKAKALAVARQRVLDRISVLHPDELDAVKIRYHGDLHLGQVLIVENDFAVIDFEGDSELPFEHRRHKHSPLRDLADMLCSFSKVADQALQRYCDGRQRLAGELQPFLKDWEQRTVTAFLKGYEDGIRGCRCYPATPTCARSMVDLFVLEKTFAGLIKSLWEETGEVARHVNRLTGLVLEE